MGCASRLHTPGAVSGLRISKVNEALTMFVRRAPLWHGAAMQQPATRAGGCFLTLFILGGFVAGLAINNPMKGVLIGTAVGGALALGLWLLDRRRG